MQPKYQAVLLALACAFSGTVACHPSPNASASPPSVAVDEPHDPHLCDLDGGRWCAPCVDGSTCPQGDSGWLCCVGSACVAVVGQAECNGGITGWCDNYTTATKCSPGGACVDVATCHDE